jgi:NitT/TauT family transport system ATP-binding protein
MDLIVQGLAKYFGNGLNRIAALSGLDFHAMRGEFLCILGPSGCGKSTLLRILAGLSAPDTGSLTFPGWNREGGKPPHCRLVFQDHALFPWMTVRDNVAFGLEMAGVPPDVRKGRVREQLEAMGMAGALGLYPHQLSGGMLQRAAIARAFVEEPQILLMDEPLRALDAQMRLVVQDELMKLWEKTRPTVIYVTHDIEEALLMGDRVLIMSGKPGRILHEFRPPFSRPRDLTGCAHPDLEELKWRLWNLIEKDVRNVADRLPPKV